MLIVASVVSVATARRRAARPAYARTAGQGIGIRRDMLAAIGLVEVPGPVAMIVPSVRWPAIASGYKGEQLQKVNEMIRVLNRSAQ